MYRHIRAYANPLADGCRHRCAERRPGIVGMHGASPPVAFYSDFRLACRCRPPWLVIFHWTFGLFVQMNCPADLPSVPDRNSGGVHAEDVTILLPEHVAVNAHREQFFRRRIADSVCTCQSSGTSFQSPSLAILASSSASVMRRSRAMSVRLFPEACRFRSRIENLVSA